MPHFVSDMLAQERCGADQSCNYASVPENEKEDGNRRKLWAPFFLRRPVMIVYLCSFLAILAALIVIYVYTERQGRTLGIATDGDRYYYAWTYGPTAVFTILAAGWTQVEYRAAQLMPWVLMSRGLTPASESIFLDYISQWNVLSLYKSIKQKHFLVSLCVAGSLILNGVTVFSTGLFELNSVRISRPSSLKAPRTFQGADYDPSTADTRAYAACSGFAAHNLTYPFGLHETYVYTPFQPASEVGNGTIPTGSHYEANVEILEPFLDCQKANVRWALVSVPLYDLESGDVTYIPDQNTTILSTADGCHLTFDADRTMGFMNHSKGFSFEIDVRGCGGEHPVDFWGGPSPKYAGPVNGTEDWRIWAAIVNPNASKSSGNSNQDTFPFHAVMCKPRYNAYRGPVRIWREAGQKAISVDIQRKELNATEEIAGASAAKILYSAFQSLRNADGGGDTKMHQDDTMHPDDFHFIGRNDTSMEMYWNDMPMFTEAIQSDFSCLSRQVMLNDVLQPKEESFEGTEQLIEERLFVRVLSFSLMVGLLACQVAITLVLLYFYLPVAVCPRDTGSIGGMAIIFAQSPEFMTSFEGSHLKTEEQMAKTRLGQAHYTIPSETDGAFRIIAQKKSTSECVEHSENEDPSQNGWYPFSSTWFIRISVIALPIVVIIALEVLYHISTSSRGITLVDGKSPFIHYIWVYIPALIMFTIRCLFTSVEFGTRVIQPYSILRQGSAPPESTILENQLRKIALYGLFDTLRKRQLALAAATSALFLAAINPIVVSGLYTAKASWPTSPMNITQTTRWNLGDSTETGNFWKYIRPLNFNTDKTASLIIHLNLSYPEWTYNNLAFPKFILTDTTISPVTGYIDTRIPALRSQLICTEDRIDCKESDTEYPYIQCGFNDPCYNSTSWGTYVTAEEKSNYFFGGRMLAPWSWNETRPSNCTTHGMLYGSWGDGLGSRRYHFFNCNATIEEVDVETRLQLPSLSIDSDTPPRVVSSGNKTVFNTTFRAFPELDQMTDYLFQADPKLGHLSSDVVVDALTKGINGVPAEELMDPATLSARINAVWGIIIAQMFNFNGRESFDDPLNTTWFVHPATSDAPVYEGVFHDGRKYLVQSGISTRILDCLLGAMVVCALIALCTIQTKGVLHKSPCSIASVASFVAGSKFLRALRGAEWFTDAELREKGLFEGLFSMRWWNVEREEVTSIQPTKLASCSSSLSGTGDDDTQEEGNVGGGEAASSQSIHSGSSAPSVSGVESQEAGEERSGSSPGDGELASSHSIHSRLSGLGLSGVEDEGAQERSKTPTGRGDAPIRFGIDIEGHRPLLDDVE